MNEPKYGNKYILELETVQVNNIRILFEVLKEVLLSDINLVFTPTFIKVVELEGTERCCIHLELNTYDPEEDKEIFEHYYCENQSISVGINATDFYKIIKTSKSADNISFFIERDRQDLFNVRFEIRDKHKVSSSDITRLDIIKKPIQIPPISYPSPVIMPSPDFQKICKDINSLSSDKNVEITNIGQQIIFEYLGVGNSKQKIIIGKNEASDINCEVIRGKFNLKFLLLFTKATPLSTTVSIYMANSNPLVLEYGVGTLGSLRFILTLEEDD
jgi:proliferating cell nuclear antigen